MCGEPHPYSTRTTILLLYRQLFGLCSVDGCWEVEPRDLSPYQVYMCQAPHECIRKEDGVRRVIHSLLLPLDAAASSSCRW